jgi:lantibiotic leader peptide-processing serine protease
VSATGPESSDNIYVGTWTNVDAPADYTNYGNSAISVAAPGGSFARYVWAACSKTSLVLKVCQTGNYVVGLAGTSMASPHVAGLAALVVEDVGRNPGRVKTTIQQSADDLGKKGNDPYYGKGRINVELRLILSRPLVSGHSRNSLYMIYIYIFIYIMRNKEFPVHGGSREEKTKK